MSTVAVHSCCTFWGQSRLKNTINKAECTLEFNNDTYLINKQPGERKKTRKKENRLKIPNCLLINSNHNEDW